MIKFTKADDDRQFIAIAINDNTPAQRVYNYIKDLHISINGLPFAIDNDEIVIEILDNVHLNFSLNDLRLALKKISANIVVGHFCVDLSDKSQRVYCIYGWFVLY